MKVERVGDSTEIGKVAPGRNLPGFLLLLVNFRSL